MALKYVPQFKTTTLNVGGGINNSQTTGIVIQDVTGVDTSKAGLVCLGWADPLNTSNSEWVTYTSINGSNELQGVVRGAEGSTAKAHANNVAVAFPISKSHINELNDMFETGGEGFKQIATPSNPSSGRNKLYFKSDDILYKLTSTGSESAVGGLVSTTQYAPEGFLINGKIVPSVSSNNLTVAIKGMDGNNPSASNPVYCRIGDTVRAITSALSVTKNAGTNWFDAGSGEVATQAIDFFAYLGYNATDGVTIGFARVPYALLYSDFSTTTTDDKYCAISTIANATANDKYTVIGRFQATLSAGPGYTWTVPTYTGANLIQRPIFNTRWLTYVPTLTGWSANPTGVYEYQVRDDICIIRMYQSAPGTSNSTSKSATVPFKSRSTAGRIYGHVVNTEDNGTQGYGKYYHGPNTKSVTFYKDVSSPLWTSSGNCRIDTLGVPIEFPLR